MSEERQNKIHTQLMDSIDQNKRWEGKMKRMKRLIAGVASVATAFLIVFLAMSFSNENTDVNKESLNGQNQTPIENSTEKETPKLDRATAKEVLHVYKQTFTTLVNEAETNTDGLIQSFSSKEEVQTHFEEIMSKNLAFSMVESYFMEQNEKLYLISKMGPTWLDEEADFEFHKVNKKIYTVIQEQENLLIGHVKMSYQLQRENEKWIVDKVESKQLNPDNAVQSLAQDIIQALDQRDMISLADHVHEEKGLLFSPYVHIEENALIFEKEEVETLLDNVEIFRWGHYDGSGLPIELSSNDYVDQILLEKEFQLADQILIDDPIQRSTTINNIKETFPNSKVVEYYVAGSDENDQMDWGSLHLVFEENQNGDWKLVALVNDKWTM